MALPAHEDERPRSANARTFAVGAALGFAFWSWLVLSGDPQELVAGAVVAVVAELFVFRAIRADEAHRLWGLGYRWMRDVPSPTRYLRDSAAVVGAAFDAAGDVPATGRLRVEPGRPPTPGREAMATLTGSMAPKAIVVEVLDRPGGLLVHELTARARPTQSEGGPP